MQSTAARRFNSTHRRWLSSSTTEAGFKIDPVSRNSLRHQAGNGTYGLKIRTFKPPTGGVWSDVVLADESRRAVSEPTSGSMLYVLDLSDVTPTVDVLERFLLPLAQEFKGGRFGESALAVSTRSDSVRRFIQLLADEHGLPLYVATSTAHLEVAEAEPAVQLTATERQTLDAVARMGGKVTAADVADQLHIQHTAAVNRLVGLTAKGYLRREPQPGRSGDVFSDPRTPGVTEAFRSLLADAKHELSGSDYERIKKLVDRAMTRRPNNEPDVY